MGEGKEYSGGNPGTKCPRGGGPGGLLSQPVKWWLGSNHLPMCLGGGGMRGLPPPKGGG